MLTLIIIQLILAVLLVIFVLLQGSDNEGLGLGGGGGVGGITDSYKDHQAILPCLNFVKGICCPHYDEEPERIPYVEKILKTDEINGCYAIEGFCALHLINDKPKYSINFGKDNKSYEVTYKNSKIMHNQIKDIEQIRL